MLSAAASDMESQLFQACADGDLSTLKDLISKCGPNPIDLEVKDSSGLTPLHLACKHGHLNIVHYLIKEQNCSPEATAPNGRTPLHLACKNGHLHIAKCLITNYKCNPHCTDSDGYTPLHAASESGNLAIVEYLITENDCGPEVRDSAGNTPLHYASESGHLNIVQCLITDYHCDPLKPNNRGSIPLHYACRGGALPVVQYLVSEHNCSPDHTDRDGDTPVHLACLCGHLAAVKYLTNECKCNVHMASSNGLTPLHYACLNGHLDAVKFLLSQHNCSPHAPASNGNTPLHSACQNGHLEVAKHLVYEHKSDPERGNDNGTTPLHSAAIYGHLAIVKYFTSELGCNPEIVDNDGCIPLHYACQYGHLEVAKFYTAEHVCNPEFTNFFGLTPLHYACFHGHLIIVKYLVCELSCSVSIVDHYGQTPLHLASWKGHLDIVTFLILECNCDPQCSDNNGHTPLHCACEFGHLEVAKYLITECKSNLENGNINGYTPLHLAAGNGHLAIMKYLINEHSCNSQLNEKYRQTPLHLASLGGQIDVITFLISECNCYPQCSDSIGNTPLHCACQEGHLEVAKHLIVEQFCNPKEINFVGCTPLHCACLHGHLAIVEYLITEHKCDPEHVSHDYLTLLCYAGLNGHYQLAIFLVKFCDPQCNTPLHCACQNNHLDVGQYLVNNFMKKGFRIPEYMNFIGCTPLHCACLHGHLAIVEYLVTDHKCDPEHVSHDYLTLLRYATLEAGYNDYDHDIVKFPLNCDPRCSANDGITPLHYACQNGHLEVAKYLIMEHKCNAECGNTNGYTPLHSAVRYGQLAVAKYLISELGCNPQIGDNDGFTPLHYACQNGHLEVALYLITEHKCNPIHESSDGNTPLLFAVENSHLVVARYLVNVMQNMLDPSCTLLHSAVRDGDLTVVKYLISELNFNPEATIPDGCTPLHLACKSGHLHIAKCLITDYKSNPQCTDSDGYTPLHAACESGNLDSVKYLITEHGCDPAVSDSAGNTPLHYASKSGHLNIVQCLVADYHCDPQKPNCKGSIPLHYACWGGALPVVKYLVSEHNCSPDHTNRDGNTPVHLACSYGHLATVKYLANKCKCNLQMDNNDGHTPLHYACQEGHLEVAKYLITEYKCNPECGNTDGYTPLHSAAIRGHLAVVEYLSREVGCNPQNADKRYITPLYHACKEGHLSIVRFLVSECNCDVNKILISEHNCDPQCVPNYTPLHCACIGGHLDVVEYLAQQNCACDSECSLRKELKELCDIDNRFSFVLDLIGGLEGFTPLHFACLEGYTDIAKYLINICNCNPLHPSSSGITPFDFAMMFEHLEIVKLVPNVEVSGLSRFMNTLVQQAVTPHSLDDTYDFNKTLSPLHFACLLGDLKTVKLCTNQLNNSTWIFDTTPMHLACLVGHLEIAMHLVTECGFDPECVDQCGATPLQYACTAGRLELVKYLVTQSKCDQSDVFWGLVVACASGEMDVVKYLIPQCSGNLFSLLFTSCVCGHLDIVKFLIDDCGCDPHYTDEDGLTPLHCACTDTKYLLAKHYNQSNATSNVTSVKKQDMLFYIWQAISHHAVILLLHSTLVRKASDYTGDLEFNTGSSMKVQDRFSYIWQAISYILTPILQFINRSKNTAAVSGVSNHDISHAAGIEHDSRSQVQLKSCKFAVFKYLVAEQKCITQCKDKDGETPLHYACASGQLDIVQYLYREKLSDQVHTMLSGDTPLHIACKSNQVEITEFLLSTGDCDPLCQNAKGITPLEITTSMEIREILDDFCKGNYPLESVVKVFVLGDPSAGKSSMVQALQSNPSSFIGSLIGRFQRIKGVRQQTAGIDSISFSSSDFGNVVIYDFAGQREFLTSHAAFLQNSSSHLAGLFIVVTNMAQCESDIRHSLQYWVSFILECCAHSNTKPHIIFVGSHEDQLASGDIEQRYLLVENMVTSWQDSNQFCDHEGTVCLDCTRPVSSGLDLLHYYLEESCSSIRKHAGKIDQRCYVLHRYVWNTYTGDAQGCTLENISKDLEGNSHFLPSNPTELLPLLKTLHDKGQVLLLRNNQNLGKSWVITDIAAMLETVVGSIFAPHDFPTHTSLVGSTGVVAKSRITEVFPDLNTDMIIGFLQHFEFCHRIKPDLINLSELEQSTKEMTDDEYYLFPALVTSDHPSHERQESSCCYGWLLSSSVEHQFFTTRFLHVLLLRLAFLFSQPQDDTASRSAKEEPPAVKRSCKMWKNGITWHDANGVSTLFEVRDLRTVVLSMSCVEESRIHCVRLRSLLIQTILKSKDEFCPRVPTNEFVVEVADDSRLQALDECPSYSINNLSSRISTRSAIDNPDLTLINPDGGKGKRISELLYFEPYALLTPDLITKLFTKETAKQSVSDDFITELAKRMYSFCDALLQVLEPSSKALSKKCADIHGSLGEVSKQQLMCEHIVETWVEQQQRSATYGNLKRQLNRYSVFCGRNPLNLVCT